MQNSEPLPAHIRLQGARIDVPHGCFNPWNNFQYRNALEASLLPDGAKLLWGALARHTGKTQGWVWPSKRRLAKLIHCSSAALKRRLRTLESWGLVVRVPRKDPVNPCQNRSNVYFFREGLIGASLKSTLVDLRAVETAIQNGPIDALCASLKSKQLDPIASARIIKQLCDRHGMRHDEIADRSGLRRPTVTNCISLLRLPQDIQALVQENKISAGHARAILGVSARRQSELVGRIQSEGWSVRQTER